VRTRLLRGLPGKAKLVARSTFTCDVDGETRLVHAGDVFPGDSPVVAGREDLFVAQGHDVQTAGTPPSPS
jgi:hypothetical protein